tara:strand:- start:241 stop:447 length:207 start_codon:yes stop_codon:yes gene_type:complete
MEIVGGILVIVGALIYLKCLLSKRTREHNLAIQSTVINTIDTIDTIDTEIPPSYDKTQETAPPSYDDI